jgi:hypothetical protein
VKTLLVVLLMGFAAPAFADSAVTPGGSQFTTWYCSDGSTNFTPVGATDPCRNVVTGINPYDNGYDNGGRGGYGSHHHGHGEHRDGARHRGEEIDLNN